jgi:hypothetical protein
MFIPLEEGESVVLKVHKHWWFIAIRVVALIVFLALPFFVWHVLSARGIVVFTHASMAALASLAALWALIGWVMFWQFWTLYYMDMWIVTDRRLIDIDYKGFFDRDIAMLRLDRVQDLTVQVQGILGSLLGYGKIVVQTAGTQEEFVIEQISNPETLRDAISRLAGGVNESLR